MRWTRRLSLSLTVLLVLVGAARSGEEPAAADLPATVLVTRGPFALVTDLEGAFDAVEAIEVRWEPKVFSGDLEILEAVGAGPVEEGEVLVRVNTESIDEKIEDAERDLAVARAGLAAGEEEASLREEAARIALEKEKESARVAEESFRVFREVEMPLRLAESEQSLRISRYRIEDQTEELEQLEKMYSADDLTEETEEIVLRRARRDLESSKRWYDFRVERNRLLREVELPRELRSRELAARRTKNELERTQARFGAEREQARIELEKARVGLARQERDMDRLNADRKALDLRAPTAGFAVPAKLVRGKWNGLEEGRKSMRRGGRLGADSVLFTIVVPGAVEVATTVPESRLWRMSEGLSAVVVPAADPKRKIPATVSRVARFSAGKDYEVRLRLAEGDDRILPGNTCRVKVTLAEKPDALTVPDGAIRRDGEKAYVFLPAEGGSKRVEVEAGESSGGRTEILAGVSEGDAILAVPPEEK